MLITSKERKSAARLRQIMGKEARLLFGGAESSFIFSNDISFTIIFDFA